MKEKIKKIEVSTVCHEVNNPLVLAIFTITKNKKNIPKKDYELLEDSMRRIADFTHSLNGT